MEWTVRCGPSGADAVARACICVCVCVCIVPASESVSCSAKSVPPSRRVARVRSWPATCRGRAPGRAGADDGVGDGRGVDVVYAGVWDIRFGRGEVISIWFQSVVFLFNLYCIVSYLLFEEKGATTCGIRCWRSSRQPYLAVGKEVIAGVPVELCERDHQDFGRPSQLIIFSLFSLRLRSNIAYQAFHSSSAYVYCIGPQMSRALSVQVIAPCATMMHNTPHPDQY